ncbi:MAG TPA: SET domain-containing protein [Candidatus Paceibacterota bacterium]
MQLTHDSRFAIKKSLPGVGKGLFAVESIKKGERILEYTGDRIPTKEANESDSRYLFEIDKTWTIDGPVPENIAGYVNHSCDPNIEAVIEDGRIFYSAIRAIKSGEELTIDYGEEYFKEFIEPVGCRCADCINR